LFAFNGRSSLRDFLCAFFIAGDEYEFCASRAFNDRAEMSGASRIAPSATCEFSLRYFYAPHRDRLDYSRRTRKEEFTGGCVKRQGKKETKKNSFPAREPKSAPPFSFADRLERGAASARSARSLRGRKEEVQMRRTRRTRGQKEGQTGRPERGTRGCHGYRRIPASPRCHGDGGTLSLFLTSPHFSFSRFLRSPARTLGGLARACEIPSLSLSDANLLSDDDDDDDDDGRGARARSVLPSEGIVQERDTQAEETGREHVHMRDTWRSSATSRLLRNSSIAYQPRVTRNPDALSRDAYP